MKQAWIAIGAMIVTAALAASGCTRHAGNSSLTSNLTIGVPQPFASANGGNGDGASNGNGAAGSGTDGNGEPMRFTLATHELSDVDASTLSLRLTPIGDGGTEGIDVAVVWNPKHTDDSDNNEAAGFIGFELGYNADAIHPVSTEIVEAITGADGNGVNALSVVSTA